jgi:hypothetical protein
VWTDAAALELARHLTAELKTRGGTMTLRPVQAIALYELMQIGGMFGPIAVGRGKTLLSFLAAIVLQARRPVLLLPASLIEKTLHERQLLVEHWRLPTNLQIISYERLGRVNYADKLNCIEPDLIIGDEIHRLKSARAGVTRRVKRYMQEQPDTKFVGMSGTVMKSSIRDFSHILRWCLKDASPLPRTEDEVRMWADALDLKVNPVARCRAGALFLLGPRPPTPDPLSAARQVFQKRLQDTPGVVAAGLDEGYTGSIHIRGLEYECSNVTDEHFKNIRETWVTPCGYAFSEAVELWRHCRSLALGFHSTWVPPAPAAWREARRVWASFVRETLSSSLTLDTELAVAQAVDAKRLPGAALAGWRAIRDTFKPNPTPVWHDDSALKVCERWMGEYKGIVWTEHVEFGKELASRTSAPYYGADGIDAKTGLSIVYVKGGAPIIASQQANSTGRNLQNFSANLITSPPGSALSVEQLLGRTHRDGQLADEVTVDVLISCKEQLEAVEQARAGAEAVRDILGHNQKILLSNLDLPDLASKSGPRWA